jgi:hypothetical protein
MTVSQMFAEIGVVMDWRVKMEDCPAGALKVSLSNATPETLRPGALAYALPYEGTNIRVFYDRILRMHGRAAAPRVMAHAMVHEITHIVQGIARHSVDGVMKARWTEADLRDMQRRPLAFASEDVDLIYKGLAFREAHVVRAMTVAANLPAQQ